MKTFILVAVFAVFAGTAVPASATTFGLGAQNNNGTYLGEPIGPYNGVLDGNAVPGGIICLDISINSYYNTQWAAIAVSPSTNPQKQAAYLAKELWHSPSSEWGALTVAIWYILDSTATAADAIGSATDPAVQAFVSVAQAIDLTNTALWSGITIYQPTNSVNQRFFTDTEIPEPSTLVLYGFGLVLMLVGSRFRRRLPDSLS